MSETVTSAATRSALPTLILCLLLVGGALIAAAIPLPPGIAWLSAATGAAAVLAGIALALHAALRRPDTLNTETRTEITRPLNTPPLGTKDT